MMVGLRGGKVEEFEGELKSESLLDESLLAIMGLALRCKIITEVGIPTRCSPQTHLKSNSGNVTDGVTFTTETGNQDLVVLLDVVQTTVIWDECGDFLSILDELDTNALADGRVGLFGFNTAGDGRGIRQIQVDGSMGC
jgi:hypothetical protein